jgi:hypothetical protein
LLIADPTASTVSKSWAWMSTRGALGFRNLTNYITRSLLDTGGFRPRLHRLLR